MISADDLVQAALNAGGGLGESSPAETPPELPRILPPLLRPETVEQYRRQFLEEYQPVGPTEVAIVQDLARKAAAMERTDEAAYAVERQAALELPRLLAPTGDGTPLDDDRILAGAMLVPGADNLDRRGLLYTRAFYRSLQKLEELQRKRKGADASPALQPPALFADEQACEAYLEAWLRAGGRKCPSCGERRGYLIKSRRSWECRQCKLQVGLRTGTVMARSQLPLLPWFEAIRWLLWMPTLGVRQLADKTGILRPATIRTVAKRIREAMAADNASELLAGLDEFYARSPKLS